MERTENTLISSRRNGDPQRFIWGFPRKFVAILAFRMKTYALCDRHAYSILFYSILFCSFLFYSILFYSILFYSIQYSTQLFELLPFSDSTPPAFPVLKYSILYTGMHGVAGRG
jgi:hypothetical protein